MLCDASGLAGIICASARDPAQQQQNKHVNLKLKPRSNNGPGVRHRCVFISHKRATTHTHTERRAQRYVCRTVIWCSNTKTLSSGDTGRPTSCAPPPLRPPPEYRPLQMLPFWQSESGTHTHTTLAAAAVAAVAAAAAHHKNLHKITIFPLMQPHVRPQLAIGCTGI